MAKKYTLHYLNDKEFDRLPYKYAKSSLGAADKKTGNAYVRKTGIRPIDEFVTEHEIAELVAKVSPHEEDGIRYKAPSGNIFNKLANAVTGQPQYPGEGSSRPSVTPSGQGVARPGGGLNTADTAIANTTAANANRGTVTGSLGASTPTTTTPTTNTSTINQPSTSRLTDTFNTYQANQLGFANAPVSLGGNKTSIGTTGPNLSTINTPTTSQFNRLGTNNPVSNMFTSNQASNFGTPLTLGGKTSNVTGGAEGLTGTPVTSNLPTSTASTLGFESSAVTTPPATPKANVPLQTINQAPATPGIQTGGEVSTGGQEKPSATKTPFLESLFGSDWRQTLIGGGLKVAAGLGTAALGQTMAGKPQTVNPQDSALFNQVVERVQSGAQVEMTPAQKLAITQNYDTQLEQARKNITQRFKALRPGSDIANDSQLQQALIELENDFAEQKATAITAAQLGLTQQQTAQLSQLAAYDINSLAVTAGISNQEAADFKKMMADFGGMIATGGRQQQVIYTK